MAGEIALQLGHEITTIRLDRGDKIPTTADADMLMSFGGGISLTNDEQPDWVAAEQQLIRQYADSGRRVLGICLGSQMVATALGATVRRNREPEVGWHNIYRVETAKSAISNLFPESQKVFHWHQDTFGIPDGAEHLFRSDGCDHQGFTIEGRIVALQFHLEANEKTVSTFLAVSKLWRQEKPFVASENEINAGTQKYLPAQKALLEKLLNQMTK